MNINSIIERFKAQKGHVGFYVKNLVTGETFGYQADEAFLAASVIKFPIFMAISKWAAEGKADFSEKIRVREIDKLPICGALTLFTDEPVVDIRTLCNLMISISDNCATNLLIKRFGISAYKEEFRKMGLVNTKLNRVLFLGEEIDKAGLVDPELNSLLYNMDCGIENRIVPSEMGMLLEKLYRKEFVSAEVSQKIIDTLLLQQVNHKIPGIIDGAAEVAHKTGEDENLSNDVGIVFAEQPFIICLAGHDTNVGEWEYLMRTVSYEFFREFNQ